MEGLTECKPVREDREPEVFKEVNHLRGGYSHIEEKLSRIHERLTPVLSMPRPVADETKAGVEADAPLAKELHTFVSDFAAVLRVLEDIDERLEI